MQLETVSKAVTRLSRSITLKCLTSLAISALISTWSFAQTPRMLPPPDPTTRQTATGGFWRTDRGFDALLRIKNILIGMPLTVTPVIYMADGTELDLKPIQLEPAGAISINIANAIRDSGVGLAEHLSAYGMVDVKYQWGWEAVAATVQDIDEIESITFHSSLTANLKRIHDPDATSAPRTIKGLWWLPHQKAGGFIALQNPSLRPVAAQVSLTNASGGLIAARSVTIASHATVQFDLADLLSDVQDIDAVGTTTISYNGVDHSLNAVEGIEDRAVGYSASPNLVEIIAPTTDQRPSAADDLAAPGVMIGEPDPVMLFPSSTSFTPYAYLQNLSSHQLSVTLFATQQDGTKIQVGSLSLSPRSSQQADLTKVDSLLNGSRYTNLVFHYLGVPGDLNVEAGSVDQTRNYVFEVGVAPEAASISRTICYWTINGDTDSMMTVWNFTDQPQDELLTLYFSGGQYKIPFHLLAGATRHFTLHDIQRSETPDVNGNAIPQNIQEGSALLSAAAGEFEPMSVAVASASFNVRNGTCSENCTMCNGVTGIQLVPSPFNLPISAQGQMQGTVTYNTGSNRTTTAGTWSSGTTSVATVGTTGMVSGMAPGSSTIKLVLAPTHYYAGQICFGAGNLGNPCPSGPVGGEGPTNVQVPASTANGPNVYSQPSTGCDAGQAGWDRVVNKYLLDQNGGIFLPTTQWVENVIVNNNHNQLFLATPLGQHNAQTAGGGFTDRLQFCSTACPGSATTYAQQNQTDTYDGVTYTLTPNQFVYSCTGNTINGN